MVNYNINSVKSFIILLLLSKIAVTLSESMDPVAPASSYSAANCEKDRSSARTQDWIGITFLGLGALSALVIFVCNREEQHRHRRFKLSMLPITLLGSGTLLIGLAPYSPNHHCPQFAFK